MKTISFSTILLILIFILTISDVHGADDWQLKSPLTYPSERHGHAFSYITEDKVLLYGGKEFSIGGDLGDTWVYDLSENTWTEMSPSGDHPGEMSNIPMAYIGDDKALIYLDYQYAFVYDYSDNTWTEIYPAGEMPSRWLCGMAYIGDDKALVFGGQGDEYQNLTDAWVFDYSENLWTQVASGPPARHDLELCYLGEDRVLLTGGLDDDYNMKNDTWVFDLSENTWTQKNPATQPTAMQAPRMAYIGNDQAVLFGGYDGQYGDEYNNETWVYDLSDDNWTLDLNSTQPSARAWHNMAESSMIGAAYPVLFGGEVGDGVYKNDTWIFGGGDYLLPSRLTGDPQLPRQFDLMQNYPNPFNPDTQIPFALTQNAKINLSVFNLQGQKIATLFQGMVNAGKHEISWHAQGFPSGVYFVRLQSGMQSQLKKITLLK